MLFLLSPAKSLDFETRHDHLPQTTPQFVAQAAHLITQLRRLSAADIGALMTLSPKLAELNHGRYRSWRREPAPDAVKQAVLAFNGEVYLGLQAAQLSADDLAWAQTRLALLSGLYGALRPLDAIQPYRLEMGTTLANRAGENLYAYWAQPLKRWVSQALTVHDGEAPVVVNLASQEYSKAVPRAAFKGRWIDCVFEDAKAGQFQTIGVFAKRARGLMARYAIEHRVTQPQQLRGFNAHGYAFSPEVSTDDRLVFRRAAPQ